MAMHPTNKHYDIPLEFFQKFLDKKYLKYTSGLFLRPGDTFDIAIHNMLRKHVRYSRLYQNPRILDVGSGWGSLLKALKEEGRNIYYEAVNPSERQNTYILDNIDQQAQINPVGFEEFDGDGKKFDLIYLIGALCHFRDKEQQLGKLFELLDGGGKIIIEDTFFICDEHFAKHAERSETKFVQKDMFGYAHITAFPEFINMASEVGFRVREVLEHSESYEKTIAEWIRRLKAVDQAQYPMANDFIRYLEIAQRGWDYTIANYLIVLS